MNTCFRWAGALGAVLLFSHVGMRAYAPLLETRAAVPILLLVDSGALAFGAWAARSIPFVTLVGCVVVAPELLWVRVPEAGGWWHLIAIYKFIFLAMCGWLGWYRGRRADRCGLLTWAGAIVPTACALGAVCLVLVPV